MSGPSLAVEASRVTPGLLGFLVVAALGVATWFLIKSMNQHLRKVDFEERPGTAPRGSDGPAGAPPGPSAAPPPGPAPEQPPGSLPGQSS